MRFSIEGDFCEDKYIGEDDGGLFVADFTEEEVARIRAAQEEWQAVQKMLESKLDAAIKALPPRPQIEAVPPSWAKEIKISRALLESDSWGIVFPR